MKKEKREHILLSVLILLLGYSLYAVYGDVRNRAITEFNVQQMILAKQAAKGVKALFRHYHDDLVTLSGMDGIAAFDDKGKKIMRTYYENNSRDIRVFTRVDENGRIIHTIPYNEKAIGADISYQPHAKAIMRTRRPIVSEVFEAVQGYKAVAYHVPVFDGRKFRGSMAVLIPFTAIAKNYLDNIRIGEEGYAWVIARDGVELYCPVPGHTGQTIFATYERFPTVLAMAREMMKGLTGTTVYQYDKVRQKSVETIVKHAAYCPIRLGNTHWSIVVATPEKEILATISGFRNKLFLIVIMMMASGMLYSRSIIKARAVLKERQTRILMEEELRRGRERYRKLYDESSKAGEVYRSLLHSSADAIVICDLETRVRYVSPAFTSLFGWTLEELNEKPIPFVPDSEKDATDAIFAALFENGTPCQGFETKRLTKDSRLSDVSLSASRYDDHEGKPAGALIILRDISKRKKLEARLQHSERMEAIGTLAGGIAHDFNNLMMGISGYVSLMLHTCEPSDPNHVKLKKIEDLIQSGASLTRQLLGYAKKGKYEIRPLDLNEIVKQTSKTFGRARKEIEIRRNLAEDLRSVEADRSQLEQVLMNIYVNAFDAMPSGGHLTLETKNVRVGEVPESSGLRSGDYVLLEIADTGKGMDREILDRIFDPFFTTKEMGRGTGLGLASAFGIIKAHGGEIEADSEPGNGSVFTIWLPAADRKPEVVPKQSDAVPKGSGFVLLVDDEEMILDVGVQMLERIGYDAITASGGRKAIEIYENQGDRIDLVILDLIMPDISGGDTFDAIRAANPEAKILLSSGYSLDGQAGDIMNRGCDGFIQKPFDLKKLARKIDGILRKA